MAYDSRATLVSRLTNIRTAIDAARTAQAYGTGQRNLSRPKLSELLKEEELILAKIEAIDQASDGRFNKVKFARPV